MSTQEKPVLLLDIDGTIFDTARWANEFVQPTLAQAARVPVAVISAWFDAYKAQLQRYTDFSHLTFAPQLADAFGLSVAEIERIYFDAAAIAACVYDDVLTSLPKLTTTYRLGVFSEADPVFQERKLDQMGISKWLDPELIFIFRRKENLEAIRALPLPVTIVDDNPRVIQFLSSVPDVMPIWINRKSTETHPVVTTIHTLQSVT